MKPAVFAGIGVWFIARVHQRSAIHGVDAD
jgi:hypothetical protein